MGCASSRLHGEDGRSRKALNQAEELRLVADYKGNLIENGDAAQAVRQAQTFVREMQSTFLAN